MSNERYQRLIDKMALDYDYNGEMPGKHEDEFKEAAAELISGVRNDKPDFIEEIKLIAKYIKEKDDPDLREINALVICNSMAEKVIKYFKNDIEEDIEKTYERKYKENGYDVCKSIKRIDYSDTLYSIRYYLIQEVDYLNQEIVKNPYDCDELIKKRNECNRVLFGV